MGTWYDSANELELFITMTEPGKFEVIGGAVIFISLGEVYGGTIHIIMHILSHKELLTGTVSHKGNQIDWVSLSGFPVEFWYRSVPTTMAQTTTLTTTTAAKTTVATTTAAATTTTVITTTVTTTTVPTTVNRNTATVFDILATVGWVTTVAPTTGVTTTASPITITTAAAPTTITGTTQVQG